VAGNDRQSGARNTPPRVRRDSRPCTACRG
jgi:hypothetical protein